MKTMNKNEEKQSGFWGDSTMVEATATHPTMPTGTKYRVHSAHVPYLQKKGYIKKTVE